MNKFVQLYHAYYEAFGSPQETSSKLDPEKFKLLETRLMQAKYILWKKKPFFACILSRLRTVMTYDIPTMAVDAIGNIYLNPDFTLDKLTLQETAGVLAHETFHIANMTFARQRGRDPKLWNITTDYIMNRDLIKDGMALPKCGLIPELIASSTYSASGDNRRAIIEVEVNPLKKVKIDITDLTCEQLYDEFMKHIKENKEFLDELAKSIEQAGGMLDEHIPAGAGTPGHIEAPNGSPIYQPAASQGEDKDIGKQKNIILDAMRELEAKSKSSGSGISYPRSFDPKQMQSKTNYKRILRDFLVASKATRADMSRPSKRAIGAGYYGPRSVLEADSVNPLIIIDSSGSISDALLNSFCNELASIFRTFPYSKLRVLFWSDNISPDIEINGLKDIDKIRKAKMEGGGNDISCLIPYINSHNIRNISGILFFTDGQWDYPGNPFPPIKGNHKPIFMIPQNIGTDETVKKWGPCYFVDMPL